MSSNQPPGPYEGPVDPNRPHALGSNQVAAGLPPGPAQPERRRRRGAAVAGAVLAVAAVAGGGTYAVVHATGSSAATPSFGSGGPGGAPGYGQGGPGGRMGARSAPPQGTVVSLTSTTITVKLTTGTTTTYTLTDGADVEKDGATSTLSALSVGEKVMIFTGEPGSTDTSTSTQASRILAGSSITAGPGAGGPSQNSGASSQNSGSGSQNSGGQPSTQPG